MALLAQHLAAAELLELRPSARLEQRQTTEAAAVKAARGFRLERQALSTLTTEEMRLLLAAALGKRLAG
jgi:hypothetical protein